MLKRKFLPVLAVLVALASCAQDMNNEDYKRKSYQKDMAKLRLAEGVYTGPLTSMDNSRYLGALQVTMKAVPQEIGGQDPSKSSAQPVLMAEFDFHGIERASIKALNAYYDPVTGAYKTSVRIQRTGQAEGTIFINGAIGGDGSFNGTIEAIEGATGHQKYGGKFKLSRNGPSVDQLNRATKPAPDVFWREQDYKGRINFQIPDKMTQKLRSQQVGLVLLRDSGSTDDDFLSIFLPTKRVDGALNFGDGVRVIFPDLMLDHDSGGLSGEVAVDQTFNTPTGSVTIKGNLKLDCARVAAEGGPGFDCKITNNTGLAATAEFVWSATPVEPKSESEPKTENRFYKGRGLFPKGLQAESRHWREITFSVSYLARPRLEEIYDLFLPTKEKWVSVSFTFPDVLGVGVTFPSARYDTESHTLIAMQEIQVGGVPARQSLSCQNYVFADTQGPNRKPYRFKCLYLNTSNNIEIPLELPAQR